MNLSKIEYSLKKAKSIQNQLKKINDGDAMIELRVFSTGHWTDISFNPKNKAIYNMVVHQIVMELEAELKAEENNIKKLAKE